MIKLEKIYEKTHGGLDILAYVDADLAKYAGTNKHFKYRNEHTASATLHLCNDGIWRIIDFGGDNVSPVDFYMDRMGMSPAQFYEAVKRLAMIFGVDEEIDPAINHPRIEYAQAHPDQQPGDQSWLFRDTFPQTWLETLGPGVTEEHARSLHWFPVEYVATVQSDGRVRYCHATDTYPILMRECVTDDGTVFYKKYEPLNSNKANRFRYLPRGNKPDFFINGLREIREALQQSLPDAGADADLTGERVDRIIICSGERDALCCRRMGYHPVWFNSETTNSKLTDAQYARIASLADEVYNIPDLDETGVRMGRLLALRFPELRTVWLPAWLNEFTDARHKKAKDLRDWCEVRTSRHDFEALLQKALPARFWDIEKTHGSRTEVRIHPVRLYHFLWLQGYATIRDDTQEAARLVHIDGNVVTEVKAKDVRRFVRTWAEEHSLPECVRNVLSNTVRLADSALENLREVQPDFTDFTPASQRYYFPNRTVTVTAGGITEKDRKTTDGHFVWQQSVINHRFRLLPPMFTIRRVPMPDGAMGWDIELAPDIPSNVLKFLINTSRLYWREEMEERFNVTGPDGITLYDEEAANAYASANRFRIDGEGLTPEQISKQKLNLVSKIQGIGYMFHKYKTPSRAWAPFCMDNKIGENGQCNGRSGKSFLFTAISRFLRMVSLSGRNPELMRNNHVFDRVTEGDDFVLVDDCAQTISVNEFYDVVTGKLIVNPKCRQSVEIPFERSPKFVFTSNYVPRDFSSSSEARMFYMVFSDYYHVQSEENDYLDSRTIRDDFQRDLLTDEYPEDLWNAEANFFLQCLQFYLKYAHLSMKIQPDMENIMLRKSRQDMGSNFEAWADTFFSEESGHLDCELLKSYAMEAYMKYAPSLRVTPHSFIRQLRAYCKFAPHIHALNPPDLGQNGRILHRKDGKLCEYYYVRSTEAARRIQEQHEQLTLPLPTEPVLKAPEYDGCPF